MPIGIGLGSNPDRVRDSQQVLSYVLLLRGVLAVGHPLNDLFSIQNIE